MKGPEWEQIQRINTGGDFRDHLDGEPIHCGQALMLQSIRWLEDDEKGGIERLDEGVRVRYEMEWIGGTKYPVLYAVVGGRDFMAKLEPTWMRFRWPPKESR